MNDIYQKSRKNKGKSSNSYLLSLVRNLKITFLSIRIPQLQMLRKTSSGATAVLTRHL
jgi:hypothetical protein